MELIDKKKLLEPGDKVKMIEDTSFYLYDGGMSVIVPADEVGEIVSYGSSTSESEPWYTVEFPNVDVDITLSQSHELLELIEKYEEVSHGTD
ncbi:hypothetical protein [Paenibacillus naphthalenovorans]|uniref:hypothetical protein n=1 Tax=Paenibacillus naphthalenovorans TaxID=162209 RepID=UPI00088C4E09|nr:hypothetical protein [Paenibacillus naphthalenovorans]SDJ61724.1 hypothetical protein SAMN05421868_13453 [Paenibacillus naphthalenovorans]